MVRADDPTHQCWMRTEDDGRVVRCECSDRPGAVLAKSTLIPVAGGPVSLAKADLIKAADVDSARGSRSLARKVRKSAAIPVGPDPLVEAHLTKAADAEFQASKITERTLRSDLFSVASAARSKAAVVERYLTKHASLGKSARALIEAEVFRLDLVSRQTSGVMRSDFTAAATDLRKLLEF